MTSVYFYIGIIVVIALCFILQFFTALEHLVNQRYKYYKNARNTSIVYFLIVVAFFALMSFV